MEQTFLTELRIEKVRHLHDITIPLSKTERKNLILTGKNGCGKTSVLRAMALYINLLALVPEEVWRLPKDEAQTYLKNYWTKSIAKQWPENGSHDENNIYQFWTDTFSELITNKANENRNVWWELSNKKQPAERKKTVSDIAEELDNMKCSAALRRKRDLFSKYHNGEFILAYYGDNRKLDIADVDHIEKVRLKTSYGMNEKPSKELGKYLVDLESTKAFSQAKGDTIRTSQIDEWFTRFENILRRIYGEPSLKLDFNIDTFQFSILIDGREPFDFNTMSMGYAAVFDIVADLMMRMESQRRYDLEGIVLIDEIETHLHVELQKQIVPILTELFPNIQFILTTHSPFILSSAPNAVIYDLEKHLLVSEGMKNLSYEGIVEGYFGVDAYSEELRNAFEEYKHLVTASELTDVQRARLAALRDYLDEVPDYLAREIAYEYSLLRLEYDD